MTGSRRTRAVEASGSKSTITTEFWFSPDLQIELLAQMDDARFGRQITRLANVQTMEPDAALFLVPEGYTVHDSDHSQGQPQK